MTTELHKMLDQAQELIDRGKRAKACNLILESLCLMFEEYSPERLKEIDTFLGEIDTEDRSTAVLIWVLSSTFPSHWQLPNRIDFFKRAEVTIQAREPDRVDRALKGLLPKEGDHSGAQAANLVVQVTTGKQFENG